MGKTSVLNIKMKKQTCKSPLLFTIPLDVYSDEVQKDRDKEAFLKIQKLEKKCEQLREKLHTYEASSQARIETTRNLVQKTLEFNHRPRRINMEYTSDFLN
ncbi:MAG: hypothetical protein JWR18_268 [Segetibacter sp.]|jgi:hypothetical protein|nr:hypothetical protein [Segetibacter sp.]